MLGGPFKISYKSSWVNILVHFSQLVQGNQGCVTAALQQIQGIKGDVNLGSPQRAMPMDPSSIYGQGIMQSKPGIGNTGGNFSQKTTRILFWIGKKYLLHPDWCEQAC
ncbi:hypothetical protein ES332_D10G193600v1 [Gossypium tomentosum]|uniref:Uncharacterized protein n=1 Tax=Gossypium tomentosum TaxID=34277 RepID=A0A5D2J7H3_GOSTO|nr:hypothetical protein ES332_D10G193600v1 [Gossypium tomentosum]